MSVLHLPIVGDPAEEAIIITFYGHSDTPGVLPPLLELSFKKNGCFVTIKTRGNNDYPLSQLFPGEGEEGTEWFVRASPDDRDVVFELTYEDRDYEFTISRADAILRVTLLPLEGEETPAERTGSAGKGPWVSLAPDEGIGEG